MNLFIGILSNFLGDTEDNHNAYLKSQKEKSNYIIYFLLKEETINGFHILSIIQFMLMNFV
ncbi:hypothetical protein C2G38_2073785, partial [Gigaspora rosea]